MLDFGGQGLGSIVLTGDTEQHRRERHRAVVPDRLPGVARQALCLVRQRSGAYPVAHFDPVEYLHRQDMGELREASLIAEHRVGPVEVIDRPDRVSDGVRGHPEVM